MHIIDELKVIIYSLEFSFEALRQSGNHDDAKHVEEVLGKYYKMLQDECKPIDNRRKKGIKSF